MQNKVNQKAKHNRLWNWTPLRAVSSILFQRSSCVCSVFVQAIDYLPSSLEGVRLVVECMRGDHRWRTAPSIIRHGIAEFEQAFCIRTTIHGRRVNLNGGTVLSFLSKELLFSVVAIDTGQWFLLNRRMNLSGLLTSSPKGLSERDKPVTSTCSFLLTGEAEGAILLLTVDSNILIKDAKVYEQGNSSARFDGAVLKQSLGAFHSLPGSPGHPEDQSNSSTLSCDSLDDVHIEKLDLSSSLDEDTKARSVEDYGSSDEEKGRVLKNDPLCLDHNFIEGPITLNPCKSHEWFCNMAVDPSGVVEKMEDNLVDHFLCLQSENHKFDFYFRAQVAGTHSEAGRTSHIIGKPDLMPQWRVKSDGKHLKKRTSVDEDFSFVVHQNINEGKVDESPSLWVTMGHHQENYLGFIDTEAAIDVTQEEINIGGHRETERIEDKYELSEHISGSLHRDVHTGCAHKLASHVLDLSNERVMKAWLHSANTWENKTKHDATSDSIMEKLSAKHVIHQQSYDDDAKYGCQFLFELHNEANAWMHARSDIEDVMLIEKEDDILSLEAEKVAEDFFHLLEGEDQGSQICQQADMEDYFLWDNLLTSGQPIESPPCSQILQGATSVPEPKSSVGLLSIIRVGEMEMKKAAQRARSKARAKMLEDLETETLMKMFGFTHKAFETSSTEPSFMLMKNQRARIADSENDATIQ